MVIIVIVLITVVPKMNVIYKFKVTFMRIIPMDLIHGNSMDVVVRLILSHLISKVACSFFCLCVQE